MFAHITSDPEILSGKPCIKGTRCVHLSFLVFLGYQSRLATRSVVSSLGR
jgi:hypothetical protein